MTFQVSRPPFLVAVGDGVQLVVSRSLVVSTELDPDYRRVADYIGETGMVLVAREVGPEDRMFGTVEQSHYAIPEARTLLMAGTA